MIANCPRCGLTDQVVSVTTLLQRDTGARTTRTNGIMVSPGSGSVTPIVGISSSAGDVNLKRIQSQLSAWAFPPLQMSPDLLKLRGRLRAQLFWGPLITVWGIAGLIAYGLGIVILIPGILLWRNGLKTRKDFIATYESEESDWLSKNPEIERRRRGWYCQRCSVPYADA